MVVNSKVFVLKRDPKYLMTADPLNANILEANGLFVSMSNFLDDWYCILVLNLNKSITKLKRLMFLGLHMSHQDMAGHYNYTKKILEQTWKRN